MNLETIARYLGTSRRVHRRRCPEGLDLQALQAEAQAFGLRVQQDGRELLFSSVG